MVSGFRCPFPHLSPSTTSFQAIDFTAPALQIQETPRIRPGPGQMRLGKSPMDPSGW